MHPSQQWDCLFSRFGVMFFDDPQAAFVNMAGFVRKGGRLALCCWGPPPANPWVGDLMAIVRQYVDLPPPDPEAPGPFAFADRDRVTNILTTAGFSNPGFTAWEGPLYMGGAGSTALGATDFVLSATFVGDAIAEVSEAARAEIEHRILERLAAHETDAGVVMQGHVWLISADR